MNINNLFRTLVFGVVLMMKTSNADPLPSKTGYEALACNKSNYVAVGSQAIAYSTDGYYWIEAVIDDKNFDNYFLKAAGVFKGIFIATGARRGWSLYLAVLTSKDGGATWNESPIKGKGSGFGLFAFASNESIAITCGVNGQIFYSNDGTNWIKADFKPSEKSTFQSACWNGKEFVAVGENGLIAISSDGVQWKDKSLSLEETFFSVASSGSLCVIAGSNGVITSSQDYETWNQITKFKTPNEEKSFWNPKRAPV